MTVPPLQPVAPAVPVAGWFGGFDFETVGTTYTANAKAARRVGEVLVSG